MGNRKKEGGFWNVFESLHGKRIHEISMMDVLGQGLKQGPADPSGEEDTRGGSKRQMREGRT